MTTLTNAEVRFEAALNGLQARGVHLRMNVMECCRSCVNWEKLELPNEAAADTTPVAWHYGGQGNELVWRHGHALFLDELPEDDEDDEYSDFGRRRRDSFGGRDARPAGEVLFNHDGPDLVAAQTLAEVFRGEGFEVEWDGTQWDCVHVLVP
jgi:hypothetical protein